MATPRRLPLLGQCLADRSHEKRHPERFPRRKPTCRTQDGRRSLASAWPGGTSRGAHLAVDAPWSLEETTAQLPPPVSLSRSAWSASSLASEPESSAGTSEEYDVASPASASAFLASCCCLTWASHRACASACCFSQAARCSSKPWSHSPVSGSKPSG